MNTTLTSQSPTAADEDPDLLTPGAELARARAARKLELAEVVKALRIPRAKVVALESDQYDQFPGDVFVRGHLRAYSKLVGLDEEDLLARYQNFVAASHEVAILIEQEPGPRLSTQGPNRAWLWLLLPAALLVAALTLLWPAAEPPRAIAPTEPAVEVAEPVPEAQPEPAPTQVPAAVVGEPAPAAAIEKPAVEPSAGVDELSISVSEECWLEVSDANGDVLATEMLAPGSERRLQGRAPFNVMLGNVRAAQLALNGQPVAVAPRGGARALRLSVAAQE